MNPDLSYIKCDTCLEWFHSSCFNFKEEKINDKKNFICDNCKIKK